MPKLTLIRGLPGSGKSTLAKSMVEANHYEADMFFVNTKGEYHFNPSNIYKAHAWCQGGAAHSLEIGENVVVSNTFSQLWEIEPYKKMAEVLGCEFEVLCCTGTYGSIHNVPEAAIQRMKDRWEKYDGETYV